MPSPVVTATLQATVLTLCSLLIARFLTSSPPPNIPALLIYTLLSTPPNFWWQEYLEKFFPGYTVGKVKVDDGGEGVEVEKKLNVANTLIKLLLDQTVASIVNVVAYIGLTRLFSGVPAVECLNAVRKVRSMFPCLFLGTLIWADCIIAANMAHNESWVQAVARCQPDTACFYTRRTEGVGGKSRWPGLGGISGSVCCLNMALAVIGPLDDDLQYSLSVGKGG